jgi:hypothetical protein
MGNALTDAVTASLAESQESDDTALEAEVTEEADSTSSSSEEKVPAETEALESEAEEGTDEETGEWFGISLKGVPSEVVERLEEQNKFIQKLLRDKSEEEPAVAESESTEPEAELTEEDIMQALGLDLEDPYDQNSAKVAVPLVRKLAELEEQITALTTTSSAAQTQQYWDKTLDAMEKEYGSLGVPRERVYEFAIDNGLGDPQDAYWRIAGPTRIALFQELQKQTVEQVKDGKRQATGTRPRTSTPTKAADLLSTNTKDAVAEAARIIAQERGFSIG